MSQLKNLENVTFISESFDVKSLSKQAYKLYKQLKKLPKDKQRTLINQINTLKRKANTILKSKTVKESDSDNKEKENKDDEKMIGGNYIGTDGRVNHDSAFTSQDEFDQWFLNPKGSTLNF